MAKGGNVRVSIRAESDGFRRGIKDAERSLNGFNAAIGNSTHETKAFKAAADLVKPAALISGLGLATQAAVSLSGAAVSLVGALAPLSGALAAYPGIAAAFGQGMGVMKLATKDLNEALSGNKEALKKLTPAAREFVKELKTFEPEVKKLQKSAQRGLFPGAVVGLKAAHKNFGEVRRIVSDTGKTLGDLAARAGRLVGSGPFGRDLAVVGKRNNLIIAHLGGAAIRLGSALRHVVVAAGPLVEWMSRVGASLSKQVNDWARSARQSGQLAGFFGRTRAVMERLGSILGHVAKGFVQIGKAASPLGNDILKALDKASAGFERWTKSVEGKNAIKEYFQQAKAPIFEVGRLIRDLTKSFFAMGKGDQIAPLLEQVRTQLLPVFQQVVQSTTQAFGPHLVDALTQILRLFGAIAGSSGPLTMYVDLIGGVAKFLADLLDQNPALQSMIVTLAGFAGVMKAMQFGASITGVGKLAGGFVKLGKAARGAAIGQAGANVSMLAMGGKAGKAAVGIGLLGNAFRTLAVFLLTNPIGIAITAVVALGAAFIIAYKKSETFRRVVSVALDAVKNAAAKTFEFIKQIVLSVFSGIVTMARGYLNMVLGVVNVFKGVFTGNWRQMWEGIKQIFGGYLQVIYGMFKAITGPFRTVAANIGQALTSTFTGAWNSVKRVFSNGISAAANTLRGGIDAVRGAARAVANAVIGALDIASRVGKAVAGIGSSIIGALVRVVASVANLAIEIGKSIVSAIGRGIRAGINAVKDAIKWVIGKAVSVLPGPVEKVARKALPGFARGGMVNAPMFMVGEEAPAHPEFVIATNPAYRARNLGVFAQAGRALGIPGFKKGGKTKKETPAEKKAREKRERLAALERSAEKRRSAVRSGDNRFERLDAPTTRDIAIAGLEGNKGRLLQLLQARANRLEKRYKAILDGGQYTPGTLLYDDREKYRKKYGGGFLQERDQLVSQLVSEAQSTREQIAQLQGGDGGSQATADNTAAIEDQTQALQAQIEAMQQQTEALIALKDQQQKNLETSLAVSQSQYGVLKQALIEIVSGGIGGRAGLGSNVPVPGRLASI